MSGLRRSRPDKQDESLRKLHDIKISHSNLHPESHATRPLSYPTYHLAENICHFEYVSLAPDLIAESFKQQGQITPSLYDTSDLPSDINKQDDSHLLTDEKPDVKNNCFNTKWDKLHSLLLAMKDEPFSVDDYLKLSSPSLVDNLDPNLQPQDSTPVLETEILQLKETINNMKLELAEVKLERDSALAFIYKSQDSKGLAENKVKCSQKSTTNFPSLSLVTNGNSYHLSQYLEQEMGGLKASEVTKDQLLEVIGQLLKEFKGQKSYLDRLVAVVVTRAPWMLDEVDEAEMLMTSGSDDDDVTDNQISI